MTLINAIRAYFLPNDIGGLQVSTYKVDGRLFNFGYDIFDLQGDGIALAFLVILEKGFKIEAYFDGNRRLFRKSWRLIKKPAKKTHKENMAS